MEPAYERTRTNHEGSPTTNARKDPFYYHELLQILQILLILILILPTYQYYSYSYSFLASLFAAGLRPRKQAPEELPRIPQASFHSAVRTQVHRTQEPSQSRCRRSHGVSWSARVRVRVRVHVRVRVQL